MSNKSILSTAHTNNVANIHPMSLSSVSSITASSKRSQSTHRFDDFQPTFYISPDNVKRRRRTSSVQVEILQSVYQEDPKPNSKLRRILAERLSMTPRGVQVWFQNRRAKDKRGKKESNCRGGGTRTRRWSASTSQNSVSSFSAILPTTIGREEDDLHKINSVESSEPLDPLHSNDYGDEINSERSREESTLMTPITLYGAIPEQQIEQLMFMSEAFPTSPGFKSMQPPMATRDETMNIHACNPQDTGSIQTLMRPVNNFPQLAYNPALMYTNRVLNWVLTIPNSTEMLPERMWDMEPMSLQPPPQPCLSSVYPFDTFMPDPVIQDEVYWNHHQADPDLCKPNDVNAFMTVPPFNYDITTHSVLQKL